MKLIQDQLMILFEKTSDSVLRDFGTRFENLGSVLVTYRHSRLQGNKSCS